MSGWAGSTNPGVPPALRAVVLERDNRRCYLCNEPGCHVVDHVIPRSAGGADLLGNLRAICDPCHASKSAREGVAARGYGPGRRRVPERHPGFV